MNTSTATAAPPGAPRDVAFAAYVASRQQQLLRTAYLLCGDRHTAEDLVQTALAKLYLAWDRVEERNALDAYTRRVVVNEHVSLWRRPWKRREAATDVLPDVLGAEDRYDDGTGAALWTFVQTLPRRQRAVVVLRYYEGLSEAEIAEVLGIAPGTVKSQASRALATLRERVPSALAPPADPPADPPGPPHRPPHRPASPREEDR